MKTTQTASWIAFAALSLATALTPPARAAGERTEHRELPATGGGTLTFRAVVGFVQIKTHDRDAVVFDSELKPARRSFGFASDQTN